MTAAVWVWRYNQDGSCSLSSTTAAIFNTAPCANNGDQKKQSCETEGTHRRDLKPKKMNLECDSGDKGDGEMKIVDGDSA